MPDAVTPGFLQFDVEQRRGPLDLRASCEIAAPWTVIFGPSGAGKTSLLRVLSGLDRPLRGRVVLHGKALTDTAVDLSISPAQRGIGLVMQQPVLFPHMTVAENVGFGLHALDETTQRERIAQMLDLFAADHLAGRDPASLSGGEKQRVALARALAAEPQLLLLDEPFTGLDAPLKEIILDDLARWLQQRSIPALYVSHDIVEALEIGAEVIVLHQGKVEAQGSAAVVLASQRERLLQRLDLPSRQMPLRGDIFNS